jgi:hypothetical protein
MIFMSWLAADCEISNEHVRNALRINNFLQTAVQIAQTKGVNMFKERWIVCPTESFEM